MRGALLLMALFPLAAWASAAAGDESGIDNPLYKALLAYEQQHPGALAYPIAKPAYRDPEPGILLTGTHVVTITCGPGNWSPTDNGEFLFAVLPSERSCAAAPFDTVSMIANAYMPIELLSMIVGCSGAPAWLADYIVGQLNGSGPPGLTAVKGPNPNQFSVTYNQAHTLAVSSTQDMSGPGAFPALALEPSCPVNNVIDRVVGNERQPQTAGLSFSAAVPITPTPTNTTPPTHTPTPTATPTPPWLRLCTCIHTPLPVDQDADRLLDFRERPNGMGHVLTAPNVCLRDTDGDGLADGDEDRNSNGQLDAGETSPLLRDTDGDQFHDGVEVQLIGSDPRNAASPGTSPLDSDRDGLPDSADPCPAFEDCDLDRIDDGYEVLHCGLAAAQNNAVKPPLGDVDCFAGSTNLDALIVQSVFLELTGCDQVGGMTWGDVNMDGEITNLDALIIQQVFFGYVRLLPLRLY